MNPEISIIIPVYKNRDTVTELKKRIVDALAGKYSFEIIFIDDACPEGSVEILRRIAEEDDAVSVVALGKNFGQNGAILTGLGYARGDVAVLLDADLQDPPESIPLLIDEVDKGVAAVFGEKSGAYESLLRIISGRIFKYMIYLLSGRRIPVTAGLFLAMDRRMIEGVLAGANSNPYIIGIMARTGLEMSSAGISRNRRKSGQSSYTWQARTGLAIKAFKGMIFGNTKRSEIKADIKELIGYRFKGAAYSEEK